MNTNSLKRFATTARNILLRGVRNRLQAVGFNEDGTVRETPEAVPGGTLFGGEVITDHHFAPRWEALHQRIDSHGVTEVVEEAAYTWFNRLMAIRILEYNSLAPALLDYENPEIRIPRIVTDARAGKTPVLSDQDHDSLEAVIGDGRKSFEQFSILIRAYCENNPIIRNCFGGITDYTALLLPADILAEDGFIDLLNRADEFIEPDDYRKPELIGWLYQFYISEKKDEVFAKKGGYDSDEIPAATQIFTPNWIVKYMVENTLGRIYLDNNPGSAVSENWKYLVEPAEPTPDDAILRYDSLEDLKCGDLSCGSGHILNEMFDLLYQLYAEDFYSPREAIEAIFTKNMVGIDLDDRARQLAQFALLLKACQTDTAFANCRCLPRIYSVPEISPLMTSNMLYATVERFGVLLCPDKKERYIKQIDDALELIKQANVLGSIIKFDIDEDLSRAMGNVYDEWTGHYHRDDDAVMSMHPQAEIVRLFGFINALSQKYAALCMNPPYMPTNKEAKLKTYAAKEYPDSKSDLFAVFMDVAHDRLREHGKYGMINMQSWMFLSSFESLRKSIIEHQQIDTLLHLGPHTFDELSGEVVQNTAFVISKENPSYPGVYYRLIDGSNCNAKREMFLDGDNRYVVPDQKQFDQIPGAPIAYWISTNSLHNFSSLPSLDNFVIGRVGLITGDSNRFIKSWAEVDYSKIGLNIHSNEESIMSGKKWFPIHNGGTIRHWYGNQTSVVNWEADGYEMKNDNFLGNRCKSHNYNGELAFKESFSWNTISSDKFSCRYASYGFMFDTAGPFGQMKRVDNPISLYSVMGLLNSKVANTYLTLLNPTVNFPPGCVLSMPVNVRIENEYITTVVSDCISISKQDWDAHETSWDFETSPLLALSDEDFLDEGQRKIQIEKWKSGKDIHYMCGGVDLSPRSLGILFEVYKTKWEYLFYQLHHNEEELNRKFIDIYGLQDELTPDVPLQDVTILQNGEVIIENGELHWQREVIIKQFISYAVGCMMGRYRLDRPGLAIAHPGPSADEYAPYIVPQTGEQWWIDDDGIVPMMGEDCGFHDNAANRFSEFVRVALGNEYLTENMNFVRDALGKDVVDYFRSDFYTDHKKMYQNRPIYWMFSSNQKGKRAAFQCLVYMHRMNRFTPEHIRTNYLLPYIDRLAAREAELSARSSLSAKENKLLKQLRNDLDECRDYQLRLHEFADRQIEIDLDDGVVKNYATFAPVLAKLK